MGFAMHTIMQTSAPCSHAVMPNRVCLNATSMQVDDSGKVQRLRKQCPQCGPGTFMATHFDRVYCGKCSTTFLYEQVSLTHLLNHISAAAAGWGVAGSTMAFQEGRHRPGWVFFAGAVWMSQLSCDGTLDDRGGRGDEGDAACLHVALAPGCSACITCSHGFVGTHA